MKNTIQSLTFVFTLFFYFSVSAQAPSYEWTRQMGSSTYDYGFGVTADSQGNVITTGYYQGTVDFDPGSGTTNLISNGNYDVFIQKLDTGGNLLWAKSIGGSNGDYGYTVVTDDNENVYVSGRFKGTVDFNPGTGVFNLGGSGGTHIFILKLDSDGDFVWAKKMGGSLNDYGRSITYDGFGNIITTGYFSGTVDFDPNSGTHQLISFGYDVFVQKMDTSGNFIWAKHVGSSSSDYGRGIVTDKDGDVYVTGYFVGTCDFDPGTGTANLTSAGGRDVFVLKLDSSGSYVWAKNMGGTSNDYGQSVVVDHQKNVYSTGYFEGTADFDPGTGTQNLVSSGLADIYIQKLDSNGDFSWVKHIGGTSGDFATYIAIDDYDHLYTTGYFWGSVDFDPGSGTTNLVSAGGPDIFIQKLDNTGALKWAYRMGGTDYDQGQTIITHPDGYIYSTGFFRGTSDLEPSTGTSTFLSAGNNDVYVQKLSQCTPILQYDTIESCGSYTWIDGITYSESNYTALHTISASAGCDTLAYLHLTLDSVLSSTDTKIACDSFTWINGMTYTSSNNTAKDTVIGGGANGCDSIISLDLTINYTSYSTDTIYACDSFIWIDGNTYTSSNQTSTYTYTSGTQSGCDSVVSLYLIVSPTATGTNSITACDSFTWIDGITYTSSNKTATYTFSNGSSQGCDSIVQLDLTIHQSSSGTDIISACDSYTWIDGKTYLTSNNTSKDTLTNHLGCDSIVTLDLTIHSSTQYMDSITACDSFTWMNGSTYTRSNYSTIYKVPGGNSAGCDSLIGLHLTINYSSHHTDAVSSCDSFIWLDGITYTSSNNTATYKVPGGNISGCDSIITLDLTILKPSTSVQTIEACNSYTWIDGITYTESNQTAKYTMSNANQYSCDSIISLDLTISKVSDVSVSKSANMLTANNPRATYQWLDCNERYIPIAGETGQTFTTFEMGDYAVELSEDNCKDTSECYQIEIESVVEIEGQSYMVYPNPSKGNYTLDIGLVRDQVTVRILTVAGREIQKQSYSGVQLIDIKLTEPAGIYILNVKESNGKESSIRLIKQE